VEIMTQSGNRKSNGIPALARKSADLAEPLVRHLNGYRLAASAAGVAMLACTTPANASPVCGTLTLTFSATETFAFNPAHEKVAPFNIAQTYNEVSSHPGSRIIRAFFTPNTPDGKPLLNANKFPAYVASGANIGPGGHFGTPKSYGLLFQYNYSNRIKGPFSSGQVGYVGFEFSESAQTHYGWIRIQMVRGGFGNYPSLTVSEYGYESSPNTAIAAGNCTAAPTAARPAATKASAPASLGLLALGAQGLHAWREPHPN
jgi:hypothetical protein